MICGCRSSFFAPIRELPNGEVKKYTSLAEDENKAKKAMLVYPGMAFSNEIFRDSLHTYRSSAA